MNCHTLIKAALPVFDLRTAAWHAIQPLRLTIEIQVAVKCQLLQSLEPRQIEYLLNATPRQTRHPEFGLILRSFDLLRNSCYTSLLDERLVDHFENVIRIGNLLLAVAATAPDFAQAAEEHAAAGLGLAEHVFASRNKGVRLLLGFLGHVAALDWCVLVTLIGDCAVGGLTARLLALGFVEETHFVLRPVC